MSITPPPWLPEACDGPDSTIIVPVYVRPYHTIIVQISIACIQDLFAEPVDHARCGNVRLAQAVPMNEPAERPFECGRRSAIYPREHGPAGVSTSMYIIRTVVGFLRPTMFSRRCMRAVAMTLSYIRRSRLLHLLSRAIISKPPLTLTYVAAAGTSSSCSLPRGLELVYCAWPSYVITSCNRRCITLRM